MCWDSNWEHGRYQAQLINLIQDFYYNFIEYEATEFVTLDIRCADTAHAFAHCNRIASNMQNGATCGKKLLRWKPYLNYNM